MAVLKIADPVADRPPATIDLRRDNRIVELLEEFEEVSNLLAETKVRYTVARQEILDKMSGAKTALVDGWRLSVAKSFVKEHMVRSFTMTRLSARRRGKKKQFPGKTDTV